MASDGPSGVAFHWQRLSASASLVCTPRNARILAAFQTYCRLDDGPYIGEFATDQFERGLPYLFEMEVTGDEEGGELIIRKADPALLKFLGAEHGRAIATLALGGVQEVFAQCMRKAVEQIAPALVRVSVKQMNASARQFELLAMPLLSTDDGTVSKIIGSMDEVGAEGSTIRAIDWDGVGGALMAKIGVASPISF